LHLEAERVLAGRTACQALDTSKTGRTTRLIRQQSISGCLVGSRLPQGLVLGPIPFNVSNNNMADVTRNTLSKF